MPRNVQSHLLGQPGEKRCGFRMHVCTRMSVISHTSLLESEGHCTWSVVQHYFCFQVNAFEISDGRVLAFVSYQGDIHNGPAENIGISGLYANKLKLKDKAQVRKQW